jgi:hypothetical protein
VNHKTQGFNQSVQECYKLANYETERRCGIALKPKQAATGLQTLNNRIILQQRNVETNAGERCF